MSMSNYIARLRYTGDDWIKQESDQAKNYRPRSQTKLSPPTRDAAISEIRAHGGLSNRGALIVEVRAAFVGKMC
jgi:hypothetical protein